MINRYVIIKMVRKPPIRHTVSSHTRRGKHVDSYERGSGVGSRRKRKVVESVPVSALRELREAIRWYERGSVEDLDALEWDNPRHEIIRETFDWAENEGYVVIKEIHRFRHPYLTKKAIQDMLRTGVIKKTTAEEWEDLVRE